MSSYIGATPTIGGYHKLDQITTDGSSSYTMQLNSGNFIPESVNHLIVSVNGVIQAPTDSFTVSGSTITFASSLSVSDTIDFIMALGNVLDIGVPSDSTVSSSKIIDGAISSSKLATTSITGQTAETSANDSDSLLIYDDSATALRKMTRGNFLSGVGGTNTPAFRAYQSTSQSVSNNTNTVLSLNTENFDTDGCYDTSTYRFTPTVAGKYFLYAHSRFKSTANIDNILQIEIRKNGSSISEYRSANTFQETRVASTIESLNGSSDYVDVVVYQDSGSSQDTEQGSTDCYFMGFRIIE